MVSKRDDPTMINSLDKARNLSFVVGKANRSRLIGPSQISIMFRF